MSRFTIRNIDYEEKDALLCDLQCDNQWFFQFNGDEPTLMDAYEYMEKEYTVSDDLLDAIENASKNTSGKSKPTLKEIMDTTEAADMIAVQSLKWHLNYLTERNEELFANDPVKPHHREEIIDNEKHKDALRLILRMFGARV